MILVHEFFSGGGWPGPELPSELAAEGLAILQAVLADLKSWGRFRTLTTLDSRLATVPLAADKVITLRAGAHPHALADLATNCDAALIIAPESEGILARLSALVEHSGAPLLGSNSASVAIAADKWECYRRFSEAGLPTPDTWRVTLTDAVATARSVGLPLVVKPIDGVGCEGVSLACDIPSLQQGIELAALAPRDVLLQRFTAGTHASVSLLVTTQGALPLSLNGQRISVGIPFTYHGGVVPLEHPQRERAMELASQAVSLISGLRGYVGVDMMLTDEAGYLIEINPRLTTSYIGLRQVININLAETIWQACCQDRLPSRVILSGKVSFSKSPVPAGRQCGDISPS